MCPKYSQLLNAKLIHLYGFWNVEAYSGSSNTTHGSVIGVLSTKETLPFKKWTLCHNISTLNFFYHPYRAVLSVLCTCISLRRVRLICRFELDNIDTANV